MYNIHYFRMAVLLLETLLPEVPRRRIGPSVPQGTRLWSLYIYGMATGFCDVTMVGQITQKTREARNELQKRHNYAALVHLF